MALADLANPSARPQRPPACGVCVALATLDTQDSADLDAALRNTHAAPRLIADELQALGSPARVYTVTRHIRGECARGEHYR